MAAFAYKPSFTRITCCSEKHNTGSSIPPPSPQLTTHFKVHKPSPPPAQKHAVVRRQTAIPAPGKTSYARRYVNDEVDMMEMRTQRLAEARLMFKQIEKLDGVNSVEMLVMIDSLQRLGLDYHFEDDISAVLEDLYRGKTAMATSDDLFETSLRFRLLRQQGYHVPSDVFEKFRNKQGKLGSDNNTRGLIELYEASLWSSKAGESIFDEAGDRLSAQLMMLENSSDDNRINIQAKYTLMHPFHRSLPKFNIKNYLNIFHGTTNDTLTDLAKLDFNINQSMHREEVIQVSKWWKELGLVKDLKFARNQPVKWYMWPLAALPDPKFSQERVEITKPASFTYLVDDIFDVYGSLDELVLFTEVVDRWDISSAKLLPDYMRKCFIALDEVTNQFGYKVYKKHGSNPIHYLKRAWAKLFKAFLVEAKWFKSGDQSTPKAEDYLKNGIVSSGVQLVLVHFFFLLGEGLTQRNLDLVNGDNPPIISPVAKILRLCDDLAAMNEEQKGNDGSYVNYYMKEHPESSRQEAREHVMEMIEDTWKQFNDECLSPANTFPPVFTKAAHNSAKMVSLMEILDGNDEMHPSIEDHIKSILFESIPM